MSNIEQYKSYLADLGNIGIRHESSRRYYVSLLSALFAFATLLGSQLFDAIFAHVALVLVALVGGGLCVAWRLHMAYYQAIYAAKFGVLREMEKAPDLFAIFEQERTTLNGDTRYKRAQWIDQVPAGLFAVLFAGLFVFGLVWLFIRFLG